jgi:hypothetical protein
MELAASMITQLNEDYNDSEKYLYDNVFVMIYSLIKNLTPP